MLFSLRLTVGLLLLVVAASAQQTVTEVASDLRTNAPTNADEQRYRIGPGDLLDIRVFGHPEMGREARVDNAGRIRIPFLDEIQAACLTETQLSKAIEDKLRKYLRAPQVDVLIKDYQSQPVAVLGAVSHPGRFLLQRRIRLMELLAYAGGVNTSAGSSLNLIRGKDYDFCAQPAPPASAIGGDQANDKASDADKVTDKVTDKLFDGSLVSISLHDLMAGGTAANVYVQPGDIISVPEADQIFMTGGVMHPGPIPLRQATTLSQAIGMAGGFFQDASKKKIRVLRQAPGSTERKEEIYDYEAIEKRKAKDVALQANDLIEVPSSAAKGVGRSLLGIIAPTAAQLPLRVVRPY